MKKDFLSKLDIQKNNPDLILSYNLDYDDNSVWEIPETTDLIRSLPFYVQEIGKTIAYNKYFVKRRGLNSYMICYITEGAAYLRYGGSEYKLTANQAFLIDCKFEHSIFTDRHVSKMICYFVHFYGSGAGLYVDAFSRLSSSPYLDLGQSGHVLKYILQLLSVIRKQSTSVISSLNASNLLSNICYLMVEYAEKASGFTVPEQILKIQEYISGNYSEKNDLDDLSKTFFISKSYLLRQFQRYIGCTPLEYLMQTRIIEAKKLLRTTNLSVKYISEKTGFNDVSYFVRVFRKRENITPLQYRKLWLESIETNG